MESFLPNIAAAANGLAHALIASSRAPIVLLDADRIVRGASDSFCHVFALDAAAITGRRLADAGAGEWDVRQLDSLLIATIAGNAAIEAYEMDLLRDGQPPCRLVLNAHRLAFDDGDIVHVILTVTDVTDARAAEKVKDDLVRDKHILLLELQHRVANSLQIIASVLMQSARRVQSEETRFHLQNAHHRVMSIATLQRQLAQTQVGEVGLRAYFGDLCRSIVASMIGDPDRLTLTATVDDSRTTAERSVSLGLIVTELVINALKHAFPHRNQTGRITVDYAAHGDGGGWTLSVSDDGVGMAADAHVAPGLGTGIVDALSRQLDATVSISTLAPGTKVAVVHAVPDATKARAVSPGD